MPARPVEAMFNTRNNMNKLMEGQFNPTTKHFDLHRKQLLYGRIDRAGDAVLINGPLEQIHTGRGITEFAVDFVCEAFKDLQAFYQRHIVSKQADATSLFGPTLRVAKAWRSGDPLYEYNAYMSKIYTTFVQDYLNINRRHEKIKNFHDFTKEFFNFMLDNAYYFPITKTGFVLSYHCSPFASGLMIEVAKQKHGTHNNAAVFKYATDPNYESGLIIEMAKKFGFMMDINAPWRMVFNIASGYASMAASGANTGGRKYMEDFGVSFENIFDYYYEKTHLQEIENLQKIMYNSYESFYKQFSTYETLRYHGTPGEDCSSLTIVNERSDREPPPPSLGPLAETDEYFLKMVLVLRLAETERSMSTKNISPQIKKIIYHYRNYGKNAALDYINELTKGLSVTKFNRRGKYWYGVTLREHESRKAIAKEKAADPSIANYVLTGTKNKP